MSQSIHTLLLACADELTEPHPHVERVRTGWTKSRNPIWTEHRTVQQGLIAQLYDAAVEPVAATMEGGSRPKPASRPPLALEALSAYEDISAGALRWVRSVGLEVRVTPQSNIRALVGMAVRFDLDTLEALYGEMRTWRRWAAVMTGWEQQVFRPRIACPSCQSFGSIRVNGEERLAYCNECQADWEGPELAEMAERIRSDATVAA